MSGVLFYLSRNSAVYANLAAKIRSVFSSSSEISSGPKLNSCKYLRAVIEETLRISPPALTPGWREQDPKSIAAGETFVVDGHIIPPGTQVAITPYSLQRNASYFPNPGTFDPDRWVPIDGESTALRDARVEMHNCFAPFQLGEFACAGKPMAWREMSLVVAKVMLYFDFEAVDYDRLKDGEEFQLQDGIVAEHDGPNLCFKPRGELYRDFQG